MQTGYKTLFFSPLKIHLPDPYLALLNLVGKYIDNYFLKIFEFLLYYIRYYFFYLHGNSAALFFPFFLCRILSKLQYRHDLHTIIKRHDCSSTRDFSNLRISFRFLRSSRKKFRRMSAHSCSSTPLTNAG